MKRTSSVFILVIAANILCCAQTYKVHLTSGEVLPAHSLLLVRTTTLGRAHVRLNGDPWRDRVLIDSVDYIAGDDRFTESVYYKPLRIQGWLMWTTRVFHSDRISIYHTRINHARNNAYNYFYYTKDNGRPTRLTMKNVARDVADDPKAMVFIMKAKTTKGICTASTCVGGLMVLVSMFSFSERDFAHPVVSDDRAPGAFVGGVTFFSVPIFLRGTWQRNLVEGLEMYGK